jgi:hypothetical protein
MKPKDIKSATLAALEKQENEWDESTRQAVADLTGALKARLPNAMESGDPRKIGQAFDDAILTAIIARKTREEFDWKPHATRIAEKIKRDRKAKKDAALSVVKLSQLVAEELEKQDIRGRGGKLLTSDTIKRELLREGGFKKI